MIYTKYERDRDINMKDGYRPSGKTYLHVNDDKALKIDKEYIAYLQVLAHKDSEKKCTMCLHNDIREHVHEMINVYPQGMYVRPHAHPFKTETKIMIEGKLLVVLFDNAGEIADRFIMEKNNIFTVRIDKGIIHTNIPLTDVVFHEVISGPFIGEDDSVFPQWAPEADDLDSVQMIMNKMKAWM